MNNNHLIILRKKVEDKYEKAILDAEKERSEGLKAIDTVLNLLDGNSVEVPNNDSSVVIATKQKIGYGSLTATVRYIIDQMPYTFTKNDIDVQLKALGRDVAYNTLDGCLRRLLKKKLIIMDKQGSGRRPNRYRKVERDQLGFDL